MVAQHTTHPFHEKRYTFDDVFLPLFARITELDFTLPVQSLSYSSILFTTDEDIFIYLRLLLLPSFNKCTALTHPRSPKILQS